MFGRDAVCTPIWVSARAITEVLNSQSFVTELLYSRVPSKFVIANWSHWLSYHLLLHSPRTSSDQCTYTNITAQSYDSLCYTSGQRIHRACSSFTAALTSTNEAHVAPGVTVAPTRLKTPLSTPQRPPCLRGSAFVGVALTQLAVNCNGTTQCD